MKAFVVTHYAPEGLRAADVPTPNVGPRDDAGTLRPVLDRTFPCAQTLDAMAYVEQGNTNGKIVVTR